MRDPSSGKDMSISNLLAWSPRQLKRQGRIYQRMPPIRNLTSVLDSEITCTLCFGSRKSIVDQRAQGLGYQEIYCPNCRGSGKMPSRTSEEAYNARIWEREKGISV